MTFEYLLTEKNYLDYLLYTFSKAQAKKDKRQQFRIVYILMYILFSIRFFTLSDKIMGYTCAFIAFSYWIFSVFFYKMYYRNRLQKAVNKIFKKRSRNLTKLIFTDTDIQMSDHISERQMRLSVIEKITEISNEFFIFICSGECLILPKEKIPDLPEITNFLKALASERNFPFTQDLNWKW